jgi:predicted nucleotidyltransferase
MREWLPEVVDRIVAEFDPLKIVLFGSLARGDETRDSDIDLLIVLDEVKDRRAAMLELHRATDDFPTPMELVPTDLDEIKRRGDLVGTILRPALRTGKVVYERR